MFLSKYQFVFRHSQPQLARGEDIRLTSFTSYSLTVNRFRPHKRAGLERTGPVLFQIGQDPVECVFCEPFVIVFVDLHHRRGATGGKAFDRSEGKESVGRRLTRSDSEFRLDPPDDRIRPGQRAHQGFADLEMKFPHRLEIEHRIERGCLIDLGRGQTQEPRDLLHRRFGHEALVLLRQVQQWNQRRALHRIPAQDLVDFLLILFFQHHSCRLLTVRA